MQPERLPRGRHGLSREQIVESQRGRMLRAMAETMAEKGYVQTTVADVLGAARVSRETFYEQFSSKQDCFLAAYEAALGLLRSRLEPLSSPLDTGEEAIERLDRGLGTYLETLAAEPAFGRLFLVEVYAAGPAALARRAEAQEFFVEQLARVLTPRDETERFALEALVAGIGAMATARLASGDVEGLRALREPLTALVRRSLRG